MNNTNKVSYNELSTSLKDLIDDKVKYEIFENHDNDMIRHIIQGERNYWNSVEDICKKYTDEECDKLDKKLEKLRNELKRVAFTADYNDLINIPEIFTYGMIMPFKGNIVPSGWHICDGTNGTPDLRDRFIVGAGRSYSIGSTGGQDSVRLSEYQIPSHNHIIPGDDEIRSAYYEFPVAYYKNNWDWQSVDNSVSGTQYTNAVYYSGSAGGDGYHENRPPYYALYYIMYIG